MKRTGLAALHGKYTVGSRIVSDSVRSDEALTAEDLSIFTSS